MPNQRALISVSDKTSLVLLCADSFMAPASS